MEKLLSDVVEVVRRITRCRWGLFLCRAKGKSCDESRVAVESSVTSRKTLPRIDVHGCGCSIHSRMTCNGQAPSAFKCRVMARKRSQRYDSSRPHYRHSPAQLVADELGAHCVDAARDPRIRPI